MTYIILIWFQNRKIMYLFHTLPLTKFKTQEFKTTFILRYQLFTKRTMQKTCHSSIQKHFINAIIL